MNPKKKYIRYMKRNLAPHLFPMLAAVFLLLAACAHRPDPQATTVLSQAEAIMYAAPDSALQLLENLQPPKGKEQRATWALLLAQARYKSNVRQSDSLVNTAYNYFKNTDDAERKALVLYLKAGIIEENGDVEEAQKYYLQAKDEVEKTEDYLLGFLIHSHLGNLYAFDGVKEHAFTYYKKAYRHAELSPNTTYVISSLAYLGRVYSMSPPDYEKSIYYYKQALELAQKGQNWSKFDMVIWELIGIYELTDDYQTAYSYAQMGLHSPYRKGKQPDERLSMILGHIYSNLGKVDSAYYYLNKAITSDVPRYKRGAYNYLYNLERRQGKYEEALDACEQCLIYNDSVYRAEKASELIEMQAKYDQQKVINERNQLQMDKDRLIRQALIAVMALIALIALITITYQRALFRKEHALKKQEESARQNALRLAENELIISRNTQRMAELAQQIKEGENYKDQLEEQTATLAQMQEQNEQLAVENKKLQDSIHRQTIHRQSEEVNELNRLTTENRCLHERETALTTLLVAQNTFLDRIKTKHDYLKDEQWPQFKEELDRIFDGYTQRLVKAAPTISESELRLAYLIKLKMSNGEMAEVLAISPSSVGKAKLRLKDRLAHAVASFDKSMMLDVWLWEF